MAHSPTMEILIGYRDLGATIRYRNCGGWLFVCARTGTAERQQHSKSTSTLDVKQLIGWAVGCSSLTTRFSGEAVAGPGVLA